METFKKTRQIALILNSSFSFPFYKNDVAISPNEPATCLRSYSMLLVRSRASDKNLSIDCAFLTIGPLETKQILQHLVTLFCFPCCNNDAMHSPTTLAICLRSQSNLHDYDLASDDTLSIGFAILVIVPASYRNAMIISLTSNIFRCWL